MAMRPVFFVFLGLVVLSASCSEQQRGDGPDAPPATIGEAGTVRNDAYDPPQRVSGCDRFIGKWTSENALFGMRGIMEISNDGGHYIVRRVIEVQGTNDKTFAATCIDSQLKVDASQEGNLTIVADGSLLQNGAQYLRSGD